MTTHLTGTREEWLAARLDLLEAEKELTRRSDELARRRQELPWVRVGKDYRFETDRGPAALKDLFRGRSQLLVYHFMFGPDYEAGCPSCSAIADGYNGIVAHLENHDVAFAAVSRAPLAKLQAYKKRMGWTFPWASSNGSDFNYDKLVAAANVYRQIRPGTVLAGRASLCRVSGGAPFFDMCMFGASSDLRGYDSGKFRDDASWATQVEVRQHLFGKFGVVGFAGIGGTASELTNFDEMEILQSVGVGLRFMPVKAANTNVRSP